MIIVVNKYKHTPTNSDVYVGRGSVLGNPYTSIKNRNTLAEQQCDSREESINNFEIYLNEKIKKGNNKICDELNRIYKLSKENDNIYLVCFCKPKDCHGDIIKKVIEEKL